MEQPFYRDRQASHEVEVLVPRQHGRAAVHRVIYEELVKGIVRENSRHALPRDHRRPRRHGAEGVVAGWTEIELLVHPQSW